MADININSPAKRKQSTDRKKSNKSLMEKKRRARINSCLIQLKALLLQAVRKDMNQYSKLEKADILEMTVKHLRQLRRQNVTQALSSNSSVANKYKAGFNECAREVIRYIDSLPEAEGAVRERLSNYLENIMTSAINRKFDNNETEQNAKLLNMQTPQQTNQDAMTRGTSPVILQSNVVGDYMLGTSHIPTMSTVQHMGNTHSAFQVLGQVALYSGKLEKEHSNTSNQALCLSTSQPTRTKTSLKAYGETTFSKSAESRGYKSLEYVPGQEQNNLPTPLNLLDSHVRYQLQNMMVGCRTHSPLKIVDIWRPW